MELYRSFEFRRNKMFYYSPFSFLRNVSSEKITDYFLENTLKRKIDNGDIKIIEINIKGDNFYFLIEFLNWDTNYFGFATYKLHTVLYMSDVYHNLIEAVVKFDEYLLDNKIRYTFTEIPSEDIYVLQALTNEGYKLIETRMTYFLNLKGLNQPRYSVRKANTSDIEKLKLIAAEMRNDYDRFHADPIFGVEKADNFLATYTEASIKGLADVTIVPNEEGIPTEAFVTAKYLKDEWNNIGTNASIMVLSAVSSKTCKGWYKKLISEMAYHLRDEGAEFSFMHPASTNRAVIHTYESLGCKLGQVTHVLSKQIDK